MQRAAPTHAARYEKETALKQFAWIKIQSAHHAGLDGGCGQCSEAWQKLLPQIKRLACGGEESDAAGSAVRSLATSQTAVTVASMLVDLSWEKLHTGHWKDVAVAWRDCYALACLAKASLELHAAAPGLRAPRGGRQGDGRRKGSGMQGMVREEELELKGGGGEGQQEEGPRQQQEQQHQQHQQHQAPQPLCTEEAQRLAKGALRQLDLGIMMGGPAFRPLLDEAVAALESLAAAGGDGGPRSAAPAPAAPHHPDRADAPSRPSAFATGPEGEEEEVEEAGLSGFKRRRVGTLTNGPAGGDKERSDDGAVAAGGRPAAPLPFAGAKRRQARAAGEPPPPQQQQAQQQNGVHEGEEGVASQPCALQEPDAEPAAAQPEPDPAADADPGRLHRLPPGFMRQLPPGSLCGALASRPPLLHLPSLEDFLLQAMMASDQGGGGEGADQRAAEQGKEVARPGPSAAAAAAAGLNGGSGGETLGASQQQGSKAGEEDGGEDVFRGRGRPVIVTGAMDAWPAMSRWHDMQYLIRVAGHRTVPVEVGQHYLAEGWGQQLMTLQDFIKQHVIAASPADREGAARQRAQQAQQRAQQAQQRAQQAQQRAQQQRGLGYLAQHPLFDQIPALRSDILVPEYCALGEGELQSVNAWFGPAGTQTPLHYDPHHNLLAQVVGCKYVRLYAPRHSALLHPHDSGLTTNTSRIDLMADAAPALGGHEGEERERGGGGVGSRGGGEAEGKAAAAAAAAAGVEGESDGRAALAADSEEKGRGSGSGAGALGGSADGEEQEGGGGGGATTAVYPGFPGFGDLPYQDCVLCPGQMLYIPPGWWHYVAALTVSFSASFWWR